MSVQKRSRMRMIKQSSTLNGMLLALVVILDLLTSNSGFGSDFISGFKQGFLGTLNFATTSLQRAERAIYDCNSIVHTRFHMLRWLAFQTGKSQLSLFYQKGIWDKRVRESWQEMRKLIRQSCIVLLCLSCIWSVLTMNSIYSIHHQHLRDQL